MGEAEEALGNDLADLVDQEMKFALYKELGHENVNSDSGTDDEAVYLNLN